VTAGVLTAGAALVLGLAAGLLLVAVRARRSS